MTANNKKTLVRFNVQNVKWAMLESNGPYSTPKVYGTAKKISLEPDSSIKTIYGDGKKIACVINDKGKTGTITTNNVNEDFEVDMGRKMKIKGGIASIKQQKVPEFALYFETCGLDEDNAIPLAKTWVFGVHSHTAPSETFDQSTDDINESSFETALEIMGTELKGADGATYKNQTTGQVVMVWQVTCCAGDEGFDTFGDSVKAPTLGAEGATGV